MLKPIDLMYSWNDTNYYLENYNQVKLECDLFLVSCLSSGDEKLNVQISKSGKENEKSLIEKLEDYSYQKDRYALKCVDELFNDMDVRDYKIMKYKYYDRVTTKGIALKTYTSESTVERVVRVQRRKLLDLLNKN